MNEENKVWFPIRKMGWGPPCCWQGWAVLIVYIALVAAVSWLAPLNESPTCYAVCITGLTVILIAICMIKGGRRGSPKI